MTSPITHIKVSHNSPIPTGYLRVPVNVNSDESFPGTNSIYINYRRGDGPPITGVTVIVEDQATPTGWFKDPTDLNKGVGGKYLYLCYKRDSEPPILDLIIQETASRSQKPPYILGDWYTNRGTDVDLDAGAGGSYILLYYLKKHPVPPVNLALGIDPSWVSNPAQEYEVARAQVTEDRLLVRTLKLTIDDSQHLPPNSPYHREVVQQIGVTQIQKEEVSRQIKMDANLGFELWGAKINTSLGGTTTYTRTTEFSAHQATTITQTWDIPAANFGREVRVCHVDDVVRVYEIPSGAVLATAINGTPYRGTFVTDEVGGLRLFR